ncbi:homeobox protein notochord-like [Erpetoichthys calabaricus]|uniref:homeobox protein notochord-like n=1 Tax=Erpetoichthys calabaricus TaxID=27687 RepID=UPI002234580D|nr:homeobox protein notochord-like [Erpetoichthys calabaricus]
MGTSRCEKIPESGRLHRNPFSIDAILSMAPKKTEPLETSATPYMMPFYSAPSAPALHVWNPGLPHQSPPYCTGSPGEGRQDKDLAETTGDDLTEMKSDFDECRKSLILFLSLIHSTGCKHHKWRSKSTSVRSACRRFRTIFTEEQLRRLEAVFSTQRYLTGADKVILASALRLSETQVKVWFQNRRTRWKKSMEPPAKTLHVDGNKTDDIEGRLLSSASSETDEDEFISVDDTDS